MKSLLENLVLVMQRTGTGILREASSPTYLLIFSWNKISGEWSIRDGQAHLDSVETHGREFYHLWFLGKRMDGKWSFWVSWCHSGPTYLCSCLLGPILSAGPAFLPGDYFCPFYLQFLLHYWLLLKHSHVHSPYSFNRDLWGFLCNKPSVSSRNTVGNKPSYLVTSLRRRWTVKKSCRLWLMPWRKYQPEQNRVLWFVFPSPTCPRGPFSPKLSSLGFHPSYSCWFSPFPQSLCKGQICISLSSPWWSFRLFSPHAFSDPLVVSFSISLAAFRACAPAWASLPLGQVHLVDPKVPRIECPKWICLCFKPAPPGSATPPFTRVIRRGLRNHPEALSRPPTPKLKRNWGLSILPHPLGSVFFSPFPLSPP